MELPSENDRQMLSSTERREKILARSHCPAGHPSSTTTVTTNVRSPSHPVGPVPQDEEGFGPFLKSELMVNGFILFFWVEWSTNALFFCFCCFGRMGKAPSVQRVQCWRHPTAEAFRSKRRAGDGPSRRGPAAEQQDAGRG